MEKPEIKDRFARLKVWGGPMFVLVMLFAALWFLHLELKEHGIKEFRDGLASIPFVNLLIAILLTVLSYAILVCYDWLGIWYIKHPMKFSRVALASFLGYSVGNNFGLLFGGSTIRYRLYSTWGLSAAEIVKLLFILAITFWIGLFALSGIVFLIDPLNIPAEANLPIKSTRPLGWVLTSLALAYLIASLVGKPVRIFKKEFHPPPIGLSIWQYVVASCSLLVATGIVFVLLPESIEISYFKFVGIFLLAQVAVFVTQVPGGLGVFELCIIGLVTPFATTANIEPELFASLMAYRLIFYLTPMAIGIGILGVHEVVMHRDDLKKTFDGLEFWTPDIAPRIVALVVFIAGIFLLFAAALPVDDGRMAMLNRAFPLWLIEFCYFASGISGVLLLLLSRGLFRRISTAWILAMPTLGLSIVFALAGSFGIWQVVILLTAIFVTVPVRHYFHRRGKLLTDQIAYHWLIAISVVLLLSLWLYWFAYKSRPDFGWYLLHFGVDVDGPRSLRTLIGATLLGGGFYITRVLQITIGRPETTTHSELQRATLIVDSSNSPDANLALLGDKRLLFNESGTAMVTWAEQGKSCVALGNPTGNKDDAVQMAWDFQEMCQQQSSWPVFYLVDEQFADLYEEMNLKMIHIGDRAMVDLTRFNIAEHRADGTRKAWASSVHELTKAGFNCRVLQPGEEVGAHLTTLERINESWKHERLGPDFKFSISHFSAEQVVRNRVAIFELDHKIVGFATLWAGQDKNELSIGMIRYLPEAPAAFLDFVFVQVAAWAKGSGYRELNLGVAPVDDWHSEEHRKVRAQLMTLAFRFGQHFYSYQGVRNYKERFDPVWRPVYVAWPPEKPLAVVLSDIAQLIGSTESVPKRTLLAH